MTLLTLLLPSNTVPVITVPTVVTTVPVAVTTTTVQLGGNVTSDGGDTITERGVVISLTPGPTTSNTKHISAGTTGAYTINLTSLPEGTTYYVRAFATNGQGTSYGSEYSFTTLTTSSTVQAVKKRFYYKVYSNNYEYITTWSVDVVNNPVFRRVINGGSGELLVRLARRYDNFGEGEDVGLGNRVELWVADNDNLGNNGQANTLWDTAVFDSDVWDSSIKSFVKLYSGYISGYSPILDGEMQYIEISLLGYITESSYRILKDEGNTTVTYTSQDPGTIMRDIIDKYREDGGTAINYSGDSIQYTGTLVTYEFIHNTLKECFDKLIELTPDGWYWYMDANGFIYLKAASSTADHTLTIGKDIGYMRSNKRLENLANTVYVLGGGTPNLFNKYERGSSISTYGRFERKIQDGRVTVDESADIMAKRMLDRNDTPETRTVIRVVDNNGENENQGVNIEAFQVGDTIQVKNLNYGSLSKSRWDISQFDVNVWDSPIQYSTADVLVIVSIMYYSNYIEIEAASRLPEVTKRIEDIARTLDTQMQNNLPAAPTSRTV